MYLQRNGHIVLTELFNDGSRDITDVSLNVNFMDMDGNVLGKIDVKFDSIPSHTSISGDKMEIDVRGYTVWDAYTIQIEIEWTDFNGNKNQEIESYSVSESQTATFLYECEEVTWFL